MRQEDGTPTLGWMARVVGSVAAGVLAMLAPTTVSAETIGHGTTAITMEFVPVGNPGNPGDVQSQGTFGAVGYAYRIGKYEVSENQWDAVVGADSGDLLNEPGYHSGDRPVASISWNDAAMFCNWLTSGDVTNGAYMVDGGGAVTAIDRETAKQTYGAVYVIPTEDEWYKAAHYSPSEARYYNYPTGSDAVPDGINFAGDTAFEAVLQNSGYEQPQPNDIDNAGVLSPYGTMGQAGNVLEWTETPVGSNYVSRGGSWKSSPYYAAASTRYYFNPPTSETIMRGFRVASISAVPEPGGIAILLSGALAWLIWWRRRR